MSLIQRVERAQQGADLPKAETELVVAPPAPTTVVRTPARDELLRGITLLLQQEVTRSFGTVVDAQPSEIRGTIEGVVDGIIGRQGFAVTRAERLQLIDQMIDEITGLGPLETLLADPSITEIMVNGPTHIY